LNFTKFETEAIEDCIAFLKLLLGKDNARGGKKMCVMATGGGSYKFYERMKKELDVEVVQEDEMECLIVGILNKVDCVDCRIGFLYSGDSVRGVYVLNYREDDFVFAPERTANTHLSVFAM
jgi:type II pantothenate kinase